MFEEFSVPKQFLLFRSLDKEIQKLKNAAKNPILHQKT